MAEGACPLPLNFSLSENFIRKKHFRKANFTLEFRKPGWTEQSKVVSEFI